MPSMPTRSNITSHKVRVGSTGGILNIIMLRWTMSRGLFRKEASYIMGHTPSQKSLHILKRRMRRCEAGALVCYDPGSSLRKRNDLQGKDGSTSVF